MYDLKSSSYIQQNCVVRDMRRIRNHCKSNRYFLHLFLKVIKEILLVLIFCPNKLYFLLIWIKNDLLLTLDLAKGGSIFNLFLVKWECTSLCIWMRSHKYLGASLFWILNIKLKLCSIRLFFMFKIFFVLIKLLMWSYFFSPWVYLTQLFWTFWILYCSCSVKFCRIMSP